MSHAIALGSMALHAGVSTAVVLAPHDGPSIVEQGGARARLDALRVVRADRGVVVQGSDGALQVDLFEHLAAAIGALGLHQGLRVTCFGPEVPLLDGAARKAALALLALGLPSWPAPRAVRTRACFQVRDSIYELTPHDGLHYAVQIAFTHRLIVVQHARWDGTVEQFVEQVAPARTFGFLSEAEQLRATSRARGANRRDVIVLTDDGAGTWSDPPPEPDECARHKLLDLIGDLSLGGGLVRGAIRAERPGHAATHEMLRRAVAAGVIAGV